MSRRAVVPDLAREHPDVRLGVELLSRAREAHRTDHAEDRLVEPGAVELPEAPLDTAIARRVTAIERPLVVQVDEMLERVLVLGRPEEHRLPPEHPDHVVHVARADHLALRRVPELVVRLGALELVERVDRLARVVGMRRHRAVHPVGEPLELPEVRVAETEVPSEAYFPTQEDRKLF